MNYARLTVLGAFLTATGFAAISACSSSSKGGGGTTNPDAGKDTGSSSNDSGGSSSGSGSGSSSGSGSGSSSGSGSGSSSGSGSGGGCTINDGTYTVTNTIADGGTAGTGCPPANYNITYPPPPVDSGVSDGNVPDSGIACTTTSANCTTTIACSGTTSGYLYSSSNTTTITNGVPSGSASSSLDYPDGAPLTPACAYNFVWEPAVDAGPEE